MDRAAMEARTKAFALRIIRLVNSLPSNQVSWTLGKQLLRSGTSVGANHREAARATSKKHFASTMAIAAREADESLYWLELLSESETVKPELLTELQKECSELVAILAASVKKAREQAGG